MHFKYAKIDFSDGVLTEFLLDTELPDLDRVFELVVIQSLPIGAPL